MVKIMKTFKDVTANEFQDNIEEIRKNPTAFYEIKVGDIFRTVRLTSFFQVVKVTKMGVKVREIDYIAERDGAGDIVSAEPIKDAFLDRSFLLDNDYNEPSQKRVKCYNYDAAIITVGDGGYNAYLDRKVEKDDEVIVEQSEPVKESDKSADVKPRLASVSINVKDHKLFSGFGGYIWLPDGYHLNTDMETYRKAVAQAYADYLGDGWHVDDWQALAGDGFMLTYDQDDVSDMLDWLYGLSDDDGWGIELAVSEQNADNLIGYFIESDSDIA